MSSYREFNGSKSTPIAPNSWALKLCDCLTYRDVWETRPCYPHFCPFALFLTGITAGQICSHIVGEKPICCDMGLQGCLLCAVSTPISLYSIPGGVACFFFLSWYQRNEVIRQWNVVEEEPCCCGPCSPCLSFFHIHCNYPCSLFQVYMSILEFEAAEKLRNRSFDIKTAAVVVARPIEQAAIENAILAPSAPAMQSPMHKA